MGIGIYVVGYVLAATLIVLVLTISLVIKNKRITRTSTLGIVLLSLSFSLGVYGGTHGVGTWYMSGIFKHVNPLWILAVLFFIFIFMAISDIKRDTTS